MVYGNCYEFWALHLVFLNFSSGDAGKMVFTGQIYLKVPKRSWLSNFLKLARNFLVGEIWWPIGV